MRKTLFHAIIFLLLVSITLQPLTVSGAEALCSLQLDYSKEGRGFSGLEIKLFRIADIYDDGTYALTAPFDTLPVKIHGISTQKEWRNAAETLSAYAVSAQMTPSYSAVTDESGQVRFSDLHTGIYLVMGVTAETSEGTYQFENFCIFLPTPLDDGTLNYDVHAKPKSTHTPPAEEPKELKYQVVKLWKDTGIRILRPKNVTVDILKNGQIQETIVLNSDNNWSYSWTAPEDDAIWTVVEKDVPDAYTVVITSSGTAFTITNSRPAPTVDPPKTGDTFAFRPYLTTMAVSGILLLLLGTLYKKGKHK